MSDKKQDSQPSSQQESDSQPGSSQNAYQTLWQTNEPFDVDAYEPMNIKEEPSLPIIAKVESISDPTTEDSTITKAKAIIDVCKLLALNGNQSLEKIKEEFKKKYSVSSHDAKIDSDKATSCTSIFIAGMPVWFHFLHMEALMQLSSEFDVDCGSYYIDIFKDTENKQSDKCLIRFVKSRDCLQVYKGLHGIVLIDNDKKMVVNLDLGNEIANERDNSNPKFEEQLQTFNETRTRLIQNREQVIDNGASDIIVKVEMKQEVDNDDDVEFIEPEVSGVVVTDLTQDDPIEIDKHDLKNTENTTEISIHAEEDDIKMVDNILNETHKDKGPAESERSLDDAFHAAEATRCKIVLIKNLCRIKAHCYYRMITDLMYKRIELVPKFQYRKVVDEFDRKPSGDVLFEFKSYKEAALFVQNMNGAGTPITADGRGLKVLLAVGFPPEIMKKRKITTADLKLALKRKLECDKYSNSENENPAKKTRTDKSPSPSVSESVSESASNEAGSGRGGVRIFVDERNFTAYGLTKEFMLKHKLRVPFSRTVVVRLRHKDEIKINEAKLMEVFSLAGEVKKIELLKDYAKIEYDHPLEAVQAISMLDGQRLYDQKLLVQMDVLARSKRLPLGLSNIGPGLGRNGEALRGVRIEAEMRRIYELFTDLGKMERVDAEDDSPFKFTFKHLTPKFAKEIPKWKPSDKDSSREKTKSNYETTKRSKTGDKSSENSSISSRKDSEASAVPENHTEIAVQALGTVLVAQGLIPPQTNCKSLQSILTALQKKTVPNQNLPDQSNSNNTASNEPNRTPDPKISAAVPNPGILNLIPNRSEALDKAINNVMQFMPPNPVNPIPVPNSNSKVPTIPAISSPAVGKPAPKVKPPPMFRNPSLPPNPRRPLGPRINVPPLRPFCHLPMPQFLNQNRPMYDQYDTNRTLREVPTQPILPQEIQPKQIPPKPISPKPIPPKQIPPKQIPPKQIPPPPQIQPIQVQPIQPQSQNIEERQSEMLVFKNLPPCVTTAILAGKMREVGEVKFCELTGRGRGFVRFKHANDADRCIRLFHRSKVDGQVIDVEFL